MIWLSLTVLIAAIVISCSLLRSQRGDAIGIPLIVIGTFTFLYVVQPLQLIWSGTYKLFLSDWQMSEALLVPALMLVFFIWGWLRPSTRSPRTAHAPWDRRRMWKWGFAAAWIGLILYAVFVARSGGFAAAYSETHGKAMAWDKNTAYLYDGPWLILSGSTLMFMGSPIFKKTNWRVAAPYVFLSGFLLQAILGGGRGALFGAVATVFAGTSIAQQRKVSFSRAALLLLPVGIAVVLMVGYRGILHLGKDDTEQVPSIDSAYNETAGVSEYDAEHDTSGQEFLFHAVQLSTVDQTGKLDYGLSWIEFLVINPIPRLLWPEKSYPPTGGVTLADIREHTSLAIAPGAACGIVADLYARFHLFSALFFFVLGFGLRRLFIAARNLSSPIAAVGYVMLYAASLNMFAQGFGACFVPFGYSMIPVFLYSWTAREARWKAKGNRRELTLRPLGVMQPQEPGVRGNR